MWSSLKKRLLPDPVPGTYIPTNGSLGGLSTGLVRVNNDSALRASAVWACLRLRADLVSSMPVQTYRDIDGVRIETPRPPVLITPDGARVGIQEFLYSTQFDLDRAGNAFGVITEKNALGLPSRIELVPLDAVSVAKVDGLVKVRVGGDLYRYEDIWHEKQYTVPGVLLGLSPIAYAAYSIGTYLSAQQFALEWFGSSGLPAVHLKNTEKIVPQPIAEEIKMRYKASVEPGGVFVGGNDWELHPIQAVSNQSAYIDQQQFGIPDISRFFGCPADLIDGAMSGSSVTYANITQRNLQFLIMHLGPAVTRRELALSNLLPKPRYVKLNRSALLAMDPHTRANTLKVQLDSRQITPSEARAIEDRPPLTDADLAEFDRVYGAPRTNPVAASQPTADPTGASQ